MSLDYGLLQTLHRMLRQLTDIREQMDRGPVRVRVVQSNEATFKRELEEVEARLKELRKASNDKQMQLAEREATIENMKGKLNTCASNKEFQLLKDRIAADNQANSVLQDEILEQLERYDVILAERDKAKQNYEKSCRETLAMQDRVALELDQLAAEKARVEAELEAAKNQLPVDVRDAYQRLVDRKGENALASTNNETCDNCNQRMTTQMTSNLMMKEAVICRGCGSILYVKS